MSIDAERKAAEKAQVILTLLSPSSTYADHIVHPLRLAARAATAVGSRGLSGQAELNALNEVIGALQTRTLTHAIIARAQTAVDTWLTRLV
jgi:hypothetical protein